MPDDTNPEPNLSTADGLRETGGRARGAAWPAYALAAGVTAAALWTHLALGLEQPAPIVFLVPIILSAYVGGLGPGLLSTGMAAGLSLFFLMSPTHTLYADQPVDSVRLASLILVGALISVLTATLHRSRLNLEPDRKFDRRWSTERKVQGSFAFGLALLTVIGFLSYASLSQLRDDVAWVRHTDQVLHSLRSLAASISEAQSAHRGYALTGEERYLQPYHAATTRIDTELNTLRELTKDNTEQRRLLDSLDGLVAQRMAASHDVIERRRNQGFAAAQGAVLTGKGEGLQNQIAQLITQMETREQALLRQRESLVQRSSLMTKTVIVLGSVLGFASVAVALFVIGQDFAGSRRAERELREAHNQLETRVRERTSELARTNASLQSSEARLAGIISSAIDGIITVDEAQQITLFNAAAERMFGRRAVEMIGQPLEVLLPQRFRAAHAGQVRSFGETNQTRRTIGGMGPVFGLRANGAEFPIEASISQIEVAGRKWFTAILRDITERQRAEEALRESQALYYSLVEQMPAGVFRKDREGRFVYVNSWFCSLAGAKPDQYLGKTPDEYAQQLARQVSPTLQVSRAIELAAQGAEHHRLILQTGESLVLDEERLLADGGKQFLHVVKSPVYSAQGKIVGTQGVLFDITDRKQTEESLRYHEALLRETGQIAKVGGWELDPVTRKGHWTDEVARIHDLDPQQETSKEIGLSFYHGESRERIEASLRAAIERGDPYDLELELITAKGAHKWVRTIAHPVVEHGRVVKVRGSFQDITERKIAEAALRASEEKFRTIVTNAQPIVFMTDRQGRFLLSEGKMLASLGLKPGEVVGQSAFELYRNYPAILDGLQTALRGSYFEGTIAVDSVSFDIFYTPLRSPEGRVIGLMGMALDITERKRAEERIQQLNAELELRVAQRTKELEAANRELEAFSYSVSHDLRAPLRAVNGFADITLQEYGPQLPEECRHYLETISRGAQRMGHLIDDLLNFSRLSRTPLNRKPVDARQLVREALGELAEPMRGRQIDVHLRDLPACQGDPSLLKQVWVNLLSNAIKYTRERERAEIEIGGENQAGRQIYFVHDNGTGFDMQYAQKLFGVFQRLHRAEDYEGTGVGLAIAQRIIHRHGGRIWAEAGLGRGATFYFALEGADHHE